MRPRVRCAVLISGRGSNLAALIEACRAPDYPAQIVLVISNVAGAEGLKHAHAANIPAKTIAHGSFSTREAFDDALDAALREHDVSLVCEAGFMRIHSDGFVRKWEGRIINIHPSLLPAFKGIRVHRQVLDSGVHVTGCTVHYIVPELDSGPIVAQASVPVLPGDTTATLSARVLEVEHKLYPEALRLVAQGGVKLENGKAVFV
jgi:phosphoribosylglycinamide formyltransferase-1